MRLARGRVRAVSGEATGRDRRYDVAIPPDGAVYATDSNRRLTFRLPGKALAHRIRHLEPRAGSATLRCPSAPAGGGQGGTDASLNGPSP